MQIWVECLNGDIKNFPPQTQMAVNKALRSMEGWSETTQQRFKVYGRQKAYERDGAGA